MIMYCKDIYNINALNLPDAKPQYGTVVHDVVSHYRPFIYSIVL